MDIANIHIIPDFAKFFLRKRGKIIGIDEIGG